METKAMKIKFDLQIFALSSEEYWRKREEEALKHYIKQEAEYDKQIEQIYRDMLDGVQKEIDSFYGKYAKNEGITMAEAKKRVSKLDIEAYERKAKKYVEDARRDRKENGGQTNYDGGYFSQQANEEMALYNLTMKVNRLEMLKANIGLELIKGHNELEAFMGEILQGRTQEELERQAGILGKTIRSNSQLMHTIPNASFNNATFSDRIWQYHDLMKADLSKLLQTALIQGKNPRAVAKELRKYLVGDKQGKGARYNIERLMRTELARVQTEAQKQSFEKNGFEMYRFICNENGNTCDICKKAAEKESGHGKGIYLVKDMMPGLNASPLHPHCRCSTAAHEDSEDYEAWLDYLDKGGTTEQWNKMRYNKELAAGMTLMKNIGKRARNKTANMSKEEYARAKEMWTKFKEVEMSPQEREYVYEELDNNLTIEEKENSLVNKAIGDYHYYAVNKGHNQYKIYKKVPIEPYDDIVDAVLSEMFGRDWKEQWEEIEKSKKNSSKK